MAPNGTQLIPDIKRVDQMASFLPSVSSKNQNSFKKGLGLYFEIKNIISEENNAKERSFSYRFFLANSVI